MTCDRRLVEELRSANKTLDEYFARAAEHHQELARHHAELSQAHDEAAEKIAKCLHRDNGDDQVNQALYDVHKAAAEQHEYIAREHETQAARCEQLGTNRAEPSTPPAGPDLVRLEKMAEQWMVRMFKEALESAGTDKEVQDLFSRMAAIKANEFRSGGAL